MSNIDIISRIKNCKILYVENDTFQMEQTLCLLSMFFNTVTTATYGEKALELFKSEKYDLIVCDTFLPTMCGITLAQEIRKLDEDVHFLFTSSSIDINDFKKIIQIQALDFLTKPYSFDELKNIFMRFARKITKNDLDVIFINDNISYNKLQHCATINGKMINLTKKEEQLLTLASENINKVITYNAITKALQYDDININSIKNMIFRLRKKLGLDIFINITGIGYRVV